MHNMMMQFMQMMRGGQGNQMAQMMMQQNPQFWQMIQGKSPKELQKTFENLCKERGVDPRQFAAQFGMKF